VEDIVEETVESVCVCGGCGERGVGFGVKAKGAVRRYALIGY
jgi:hypothetical protein